MDLNLSWWFSLLAKIKFDRNICSCIFACWSLFDTSLLLQKLLLVIHFDKLSVNKNSVDVCWKPCSILHDQLVHLCSSEMHKLPCRVWSILHLCVLVWISVTWSVTVWEKLWWLYFLILQHAGAHNDEVTILFWLLLTKFWETCICTVNDCPFTVCDSEWKSYCRYASDSLVPSQKVLDVSKTESAHSEGDYLFD